MSLISYFTLFTRDEQRFSVGELVTISQKTHKIMHEMTFYV